MNKTEIIKFKSLPDSLNKFSDLPIELHHKIYEYISHDVWNAIWNYHLDWYNIFKAIGDIIDFNKLMDILNCIIPTKAKLTIDDKMLDKCIHFNKCYGINIIDSEKATNLIMLTIDKYLKSKHYDTEIMFEINVRMLVLYRVVNAGPIYELAIPNDKKIKKYMNNIKEELRLSWEVKCYNDINNYPF